MNINEILKNCLVFDIETYAEDKNGAEVNINSQFDKYLELAKCKWFGAYSYKDNKEYYLEMPKDKDQIINLLTSHNVLISFNGEEFDYPILVNNGLAFQDNHIKHVDCMKILGSPSFIDKNGYPYKGRGDLMGYSFKRNSLECMAETMDLEFKKSTIDYKIFGKNNLTDKEREDIKFYLRNDVMATKGLFDKLIDYWKPFTELIDYKDVMNFSWIRSSIASLTYKSACYHMGVQPTYGHKGKKEKMGGNVLKPKYEEAENVWYIDFSSLYPHIFCMFNLFSEVDESYEGAWHGNDLFKVRGYYNKTHKHPMTKVVEKKLKERTDLKEKDPNNPMVYTNKIWLNCFSNDTEIVMADNTIKNIKDCSVGDYVYSINPKTLNCEKKKILKTYSYNYNGDMHLYKGNYFNFYVTPNHRFLLMHKDTNKLSFKESIDIQSNHKIPIHNKTNKKFGKINILDYINKKDCIYKIKAKNIHGRTFLHKYNLNNKEYRYNCEDRNFIFDYENIKKSLNSIIKDKTANVYIIKKSRRYEHKKNIFYPIDDFSYLIGIYLAEGSLSKTLKKYYPNGNYRGDVYSVSISQYESVNEKICRKIEKCLQNCNLKYSKSKQAFKISGSILYDFLLNNFGKLDYKHFINKRFLNILNLEKVFEGLIDGDGTKNCNLFSTKYDCLKNDFIEICLRLGYTFTIDNDGCWRIRYNNKPKSFRKTSREIKKYNGIVYCCEVEDNNTLLAGRHGKFHWVGNSLYGCARSSVFEKVHTKNCGWDCCWLGQQLQKFVQEELNKKGFESIYGDTDSLMIKCKDKKHNDYDYIKLCLKSIIKKIFNNVPFPIETFNMDIECFIDYILFPFSEEPILDKETRDQIRDGKLENFIEEKIGTRKYIIDTNTGKIVKEGRSWVKEKTGKKKNYLYLYSENNERKIKVVGMPLKKDNATPLGFKIFEEILKPLILKNKRAKFSKDFIDNHIDNYLKNKEIMKLCAVEYKVKSFDSYKIPKGKDEPTGIHAQISKNYFNKRDGVIQLIKNKKIGKIGKADKYCTIDEALEAKLTSKDLILEKVYNELEPFISYEKS